MSAETWGSVAAEQNVMISLDIDEMPLAGVRDEVRALLAEHSGLVAEDAVQVSDELVSNAFRHGQSPRTMRVSRTVDGRRLRIEVDDTAEAGPVKRTPDHTGGLGLLLVERLALAWGTRLRRTHKTVWAELDLSGPAGYLAAVACPRPPG